MRFKLEHIKLSPKHPGLYQHVVSAQLCHPDGTRLTYEELSGLAPANEETTDYNFDEAFPVPVRAHIVINGDVSDAKALRDAARVYSAEALGYIVTVMRYSRDEKVKLQAADLILNRAIGKPVAPTGVMEGNELKEALGSIVLPDKRKRAVAPPTTLGAATLPAGTL